MRLQRLNNPSPHPVRLPKAGSKVEAARDLPETEQEPRGKTRAAEWHVVGMEFPESEGSGHRSEKRERPSHVLSHLHSAVDNPDFRLIVAAACRFVRNRPAGSSMSRSECELVRRSIRSNWPTEPGKLKKTVADLLATLSDQQSASAAESAADTLRLAIDAGIFPAIGTEAAQ